MAKSGELMFKYLKSNMISRHPSCLQLQAKGGGGGEIVNWKEYVQTCDQNDCPSMKLFHVIHVQQNGFKLNIQN